MRFFRTYGRRIGEWPESAAAKAPPSHSVGQAVGCLTLIERVDDTAWRCLCVCGSELRRSDAQLASKKTHHCGCGGPASLRSHPLYNIWSTMRSRCAPAGSGDTWENYGGRGIRVCARWQHSFDAFVQDMGPRPSTRHSIERIDVNGDYTPDNCKWATSTEQNRNRRNVPLITFQGRTMCRSAWAEHLGITLATLTLRLKRWPLTRALTESPATSTKRAA